MLFFQTFWAFVFEVEFWRVFWMILACENLQKTYKKQWFSSFSDFLKKCNKILKNRANKTSKIIKIHEKYPSETMLFFCFVVSSDLWLILAPFWSQFCSHFADLSHQQIKLFLLGVARGTFYRF